MQIKRNKHEVLNIISNIHDAIKDGCLDDQTILKGLKSLYSETEETMINILKKIKTIKSMVYSDGSKDLILALLDEVEGEVQNVTY